MVKNKTEIQFINHASIVISHGSVKLLSDPWYQGDAFHKGWNLIHELSDKEIYNLLNDITHIWISHEHPDHFSIMFFKKFGEQIKEKGIQIIFQNTADKRVESFLSKSGYNLNIIKFNSWINLSTDFEILCIKDGFYDSGLAVKTPDKTILNFNDCEIKDDSRCKEVHKIVGECDVLVSQFSFAAWKGGVENTAWRKKAAKEKLNTLKLQAKYFKPKVLIPFASYVYFSNKLNSYLNDSSNKPRDVIDTFLNEDVKVNVMKPFESFDDLVEPINNKESLSFWDIAFQSASENDLKVYEKIDLKVLEESFINYQERVFKNNSKSFMRIIRTISPVNVFKPVVIKINDLDININLDIFAHKLSITSLTPHISMSSESLNFIMTNTFGFDTLTVNGCFEEESNSGFSIATRSLAIENLNNMGISFQPSIIFNFQLITLFISRLIAVSKKIKLQKNDTNSIQT
tara:strand:+ start:173 stop:1549 length:1377 start_codon:yes stop_codon:yes gene_type:complete